MQIYLNGSGTGYEAEHTARLFFPSAQLVASSDVPSTQAEKIRPMPKLPEGDLVAAVCQDSQMMVLVRQGERTVQKQEAQPLLPEQQEYALCRLLYHTLCSFTGRRPPWGMMTGVRPVRIIHDMRAAGAAEEEIEKKFCEHFECAPEKFALAREIANRQRPILAAAQPMDYSLYAGIPFCPTRCSYCSFVSRTMGDKANRALVAPYVDALCRELAEIQRVAGEVGLSLKTIYIGGGTPTSLSAEQLRQLMGTIRAAFNLNAVAEYTVEAGRPDCTDAEKLAVLKEYGVTRISINPQTFSDQVLQNIGRRHTAQDVVHCFEQARAAGHKNINMDLIAGLPGDTVEGFAQSLQAAIELGPENITVHTLTLKRASNLVVEHRAAAYDDVAAMLQKCALLLQAGYQPYYLYRQKGTLQNLENIGWSKPGFACLYNIYIMEEVHSILSAGAGGSTKLVPPGQRHGHIERIFNYKFPAEYLSGFSSVIARKQGVKDFYGSSLYPQTTGQQ